MLLGGGYTSKIVWFMKDSQAAKSEPVIVEQQIVTMNSEEITDVINDKIDLLEFYGDNTPVKCKDLWPRKVNNVLINSKCKFYCSYSQSCPHNKPTALQAASAW